MLPICPPMTEDSLEVIVADDELAVRRGVELLLRDAGFRVAGVAATVSETRALVTRRRFDVALMELSLGGESTTGLAAELLRAGGPVPLVVYAGRETPSHGLAAAAALDPPGFVLKSSPPAVLVDALREVASGGAFVDPELARRLPGPGRRPRRESIAALSPREREVLGLLADGFSGAEIAGRLFLSAETVRTHVRNAIQKLGARTRTQAVAMLVADGGAAPALVSVD
jgi:DNA-binding NarL/FixJ family response regulator